ncbi:LexA family transcriptional regulator [Pseudomonas sp. EGD-AK9]|uniref:LexA family protein n=1 Tax=Pseudomonas sp. EGD-AK9 TaxID=1386078 RepID=UPI0004CE1542
MPTPIERQQALADLLRTRRQELKMSQKDVAEGVRALLGGETFKQQSYAAIESGKTKHSKYLPQIARVLGIPLEAVSPVNPAQIVVREAAIPYGDQATVVGEAGRKLPVIGSVAAGVWCEAIDEFQPGDADEWIEAPGPVGPHAFVLKIEGISMYNPAGPVSFSDGDKVVVDPDREAKSGDFVVAKVASQNAVTFKRLRYEDGQWYLEAINPDWKPKYIHLTEEWHICGRGMWKVQQL